MSLYDQASGVVRTIYDRRINTPAILNTEHYFPRAGAYQQQWRDIRAESQAIRLENVPRFHELMDAQADISANDGRDWRMFILRAYGVDVAQNIARCPAIAALLNDSPEVVSCALSFLAPGKHIPRHRGPFRGILRFHLMLTMPRGDDGGPAAILEIDGKPYRLGEGDCLLWDDTYPHEVWNRSNEVRAALLLDVWRRDMPADINILSRAIVGLVKLHMRFGGLSYGG